MVEGDPTAPTGPRAAARGGLRRALGASRSELLLGGGAALASMIFIARQGRNFWFRFDNFELLTDRQFGSINDWFRPHDDHWLTWTVLFSRGLYQVAGMDFWPWWYLPRLVGAAAVAFLVWRTLVHRGADRMIAFGTYLALLVLAVSYFQDALTVANYVLFPSLLVVALVVGEVELPRRRHLAVVAICLVAAVMANGYGFGILLGVAVVVAVRRRFLRWLPSLIPPAVAVGAWYLRYRSDLPRQGQKLSPGFVFDAIRSSFVVVRSAVQNTFGLPSAVAVLVVAAIAGQLVWLIYRRRLDMFDAIVVLTLLFVLAILAWARTTDGILAEQPRYGYAVVLLLTLVLVPRLSSPTSGVARAGVAMVLVAVVAFNAVSLSRRLHDTGVVSQSIRATAQTAAALIHAGEPYSNYSRLGWGVAPRELQRLVNDGWNPRRSTNPKLVNAVRGKMLIVFLGRNAPLIRAAGRVAPEAVGVDAAGCVQVTGPTVVTLTVKGPTAFTVDRGVVITWTDRFGTAQRSPRGPVTVALAGPTSKTTVTVRALGQQPTNICALTPIRP